MLISYLNRNKFIFRVRRLFFSFECPVFERIAPLCGGALNLGNTQSRVLRSSGGDALPD